MTQKKLRTLMKKEFASPSGSVRPGTQCKRSWASPEDLSPSTKINLIIDFSRRRISEIKLKRTDTTLDLSQKAKRAKEKKKEKGRVGGTMGLYRWGQRPGSRLLMTVCIRMVADILNSPTSTEKSCNVHPAAQQRQPHMIIS